MHRIEMVAFSGFAAMLREYCGQLVASLSLAVVFEDVNCCEVVNYACAVYVLGKKHRGRYGLEMTCCYVVMMKGELCVFLCEQQYAPSI